MRLALVVAGTRVSPCQWRRVRGLRVTLHATDIVRDRAGVHNKAGDGGRGKDAAAAAATAAAAAEAAIVKVRGAGSVVQLQCRRAHAVPHTPLPAPG